MSSKEQGGGFSGIGIHPVYVRTVEPRVKNCWNKEIVINYTDVGNLWFEKTGSVILVGEI